MIAGRVRWASEMVKKLRVCVGGGSKGISQEKGRVAWRDQAGCGRQWDQLCGSKFDSEEKPDREGRGEGKRRGL